MSRKSAIFLTSALVSAGLIANPLAAEARGMSRIGTAAGNAALKSVLNCGGVTMGQPGPVSPPAHVFAPVTMNQGAVNQSANLFGSVGGNTNIVNKPINVQTNIDNSKSSTINKPVTVTNNNVDVKNIEINKNIDASKNININKNVNINVNTNNNTTTVTDNSNSYSTSTGYASAYADSGSNAVSSSLGGGDFAVSAADAAATDYVAKGGQCSYVDATVVKAIHAVCISADGREFPAAHMVGTSWIASGYDGEIARCLPGSTLKVSIGSVVQSDQGMAASMSGAQILTCDTHQAVRHYKDGMLKCAPAVKVVDCTERTNLRKWGTGDMFFSYVTKVCLDETKLGGQSRESADQAAQRARAAYSSRYSSGYTYGSADEAISRRSQGY